MPYTMYFMPANKTAIQDGTCWGSRLDMIPVGQAVSDSDGDIGPTEGIVPSGVPDGYSLVCFVSDMNLSAMTADTLTVTGGERCAQDGPTVNDDGPTGPEAEGGCARDDVDGVTVNNVEGGAPVSSPATMTELVELFGGSADGISEEALVASSGASVSSSGDGFQSGGCPPGGTCTDLELRWIGAIDIDKRSEDGAVRLYKGFVSHYWLVPDEESGGDRKGTGADGRTYDFLSSRAELTPEVGNAVLCSRKNTVTRAGGASPAILANYPSAVTTAVSPDTANTLTLSARGFSVSHQFTTAQGHIQGVYDPAVPSFTGTWVFGGQCSGTTTPDGVALDSGIAYVYEPDDPAVAARGYTFAGKTRRIETNGAAIPCGFLCF